MGGGVSKDVEQPKAPMGGGVSKIVQPPSMEGGVSRLVQPKATVSQNVQPPSMEAGASKDVQLKATNSWFKSAKKHCKDCGQATTKAERPACKSCGSKNWNLEVGMGAAGGGSMGGGPGGGPSSHAASHGGVAAPPSHGGMGAPPSHGGIHTENRWADLFRFFCGNSVAASGLESAVCAGRLEYGRVSDVFNVPLFAARRSFPPSWCHSARTRGLRLFTSQRTVPLTPPTTPWPRSMQVCCQAFPFP
jgi:hypothetical protein